jgi:hypothetical protein
MTTALPRRVKTSDYRPAVLVIRISWPQPCRNCGLGIAYCHDQGLGGDWVHTDTERVPCATRTPRGQIQLANPIPKCPRCHSKAVTWTTQAWGNAEDCPDCGYHDFHSIGD